MSFIGAVNKLHFNIFGDGNSVDILGVRFSFIDGNIEIIYFDGFLCLSAYKVDLSTMVSGNTK